MSFTLLQYHSGLFRSLNSGPWGRRFQETAPPFFTTHYPKIKEGTVAAHLIRFSTNAPSRVHNHPKPGEDNLFQLDGSHFRLYDPATDPPPIIGTAKAITPPPPTVPSDDDEPNANEFAYTSQIGSIEPCRAIDCTVGQRASWLGSFGVVFRAKP